MNTEKNPRYILNEGIFLLFSSMHLRFSSFEYVINQIV